MRQARCPFALTALALGQTAAPAFAERNLMPTLEPSFDVCPGRLAEPHWTQNIPLRQAYQRILLQNIYRAQNLERIVETGSCTCDIRFPDWEGSRPPSANTMPASSSGKCCKPLTATANAPMKCALRPRQSATPRAIGQANP